MRLSSRPIWTITFLVIAITAWATIAWSASKQEERLGDAQKVLQEIMDMPDKGLPDDLLSRAACIGIIPGVKKFAFGFGAQHGSGYVLCRRNRGNGSWGVPSGFSMSGGSFGLQLGASSTDYVLLFMNFDGIEALLEDKFTLGADASVAAGPVGRKATVATDAQMTAKVLAYSRSKGLFAGIALEGAVLRPSGDDNKDLYGREVSPRALLVEGSVAPPAAAGPLLQLLRNYSAARTEKPL